MGGIFSTPKIPAPPPPPAPLPAPTIDAAKQQQQAQDRLAGRKGAGSAILTGAAGDLSTPPTSAAKQLLGS
jgi:hypothetical protein